MKYLIPISLAFVLIGAGCSPQTEAPSALAGHKTDAPAQTSTPPTNTATSTAVSAAAIDNVLVSDTADSDSYVTETKDTISKDAKNIYVTAQISDAQKDMEITNQITYLADGTKYDPQTVKATDSGNVQQAFSLEKSEDAWPTGDYEAKITLSNGITKSAKFSVK